MALANSNHHPHHQVTTTNEIVIFFPSLRNSSKPSDARSDRSLPLVRADSIAERQYGIMTVMNINTDKQVKKKKMCFPTFQEKQELRLMTVMMHPGMR